MPSARRSRRISAQSSTPNTPLPPQLDNEPGSSRVVSFRLPEGGQSSRAVDRRNGSGKRIEQKVVHVFHVNADGKATDWWNFWEDQATLDGLFAWSPSSSAA